MTKPAPLPDWSALLAERDATIERLRAVVAALIAYEDHDENEEVGGDMWERLISDARAALAQEPRT